MLDSTAPISFRVTGEPKPQPRPRAVKRGDHAGVFDPGTADGWRAKVYFEANQHRPIEPWTGPLRIWLTFFLKRPKRLLRKKDPDDVIPADRKPDADNLAKAVLDELTDMGYWGDDSQIQDMRVMKYYTARTGDQSLPGCEIVIWRVDP